MKSEPRSVLEAVHIILLLVCEENTSFFLVHSNPGFLGMGYTCKCILLQVVLATLLMSSKCWARIMWFISYWTLVAICSGDEPGYFQLQPGWAHTVSWWNMPVISFNLWQTLTNSDIELYEDAIGRGVTDVQKQEYTWCSFSLPKRLAPPQGGSTGIHVDSLARSNLSFPFC